MSEFKLIELIRARTGVARPDVALGIGDDAALLELPRDRQLVACTDTLVAGVHFPHDTLPEDIGWKALAVNLSDLAAMGAAPAWALLALTLPDADARFVERFADGFAELARAHGVALVGGDTTQGPLTVTVTALGVAPRGKALTRSGARVGDAVFVTGTLGDAAGALQWLRDSGLGTRDSGESQGNHPLRHEGGRCAAAGGCGCAELDAGAYRQDAATALLTRLHRPQPRIAAGLALRGIASACIDVSDGLLADLGHVCAASKVGAEIEADALPVSPQLAASFDAQICRELALTGGDDYELCFTADAARETEVIEALARAGCTATRMGRIVDGSSVSVTDSNGHAVEVPHAGWEHFSQ